MIKDINAIIDIIERRGSDEIFLQDLKEAINSRFPPNANLHFDLALERFALALKELL